MAVIEEIKMELGDLTALKTVTGAYSDISALRIQSLKSAFEQNMLFYEQVTQLYHSIRLTAYMQKYLQKKKKFVSDLHPKTLHVAVTSNHRFYGTLNRDIMIQFMNDSKNRTEDRLIIGKTGKDFAQAHPEIGPYNVLVFQTDMPPKHERDSFLSLSLGYDRVFLYYPRFINILTQTVDRIDITYAPKSLSGGQKHIKYIFEPELPKIISFFEQQVRGLLFARVLLETDLARTATRLFAMDTAEREAQNLIKKTKAELIKAKQSLINRRLLETISFATQFRQ